MKIHKKINYNLLFLLFVALFPILPTYFEVLSFPVYRLIGILVVLLGGLYCYEQGYLKNIPTTWENGKQWILTLYQDMNLSKLELLFLIWIAWKAVTCVFNRAVTNAFWLIMLAVICIIVVVYVNNMERLNQALDVLIYTAGIVGIFGIIECMTHFNIFNVINTVGAQLNYNPPRFGLLRILSFSSHTIHYCLYCMLILGLIFYRGMNSDKKIKYAVIYGIVFINAILTLSRSSLLCLFACQIILFYFTDPKGFWKKMGKLILAGGILGILACLLIPAVREALKSFILMFLVIIDNTLAPEIAANYGTDNIYGIGNRFDLYSWVMEELKGHTLMGVGPWNEFNHLYQIFRDGEWIYQRKIGIEVNYLDLLYKYGIFTLILEVAAYGKAMVTGIFSKDTPMKSEKVLTFSKTCGTLILSYLVCWFAVGQGSEIKLILMIVALFFAYIRIGNRKESL